MPFPLCGGRPQGREEHEPSLIVGSSYGGAILMQ